jgi:hypothetical protein
MSQITGQPALDFLSRLFPSGIADAELLAEVCPEGWESSPLWLAFHPGPERRYEERCAFMKNMERIKRTAEPGPPVPTFEEFLADEKEGRCSLGGPLEEWTELLGDCLWDTISNNHDLILASGEQVNFGSFRMVSALIDGFISGETLGDAWDCGDCMRFYMGTSFVSGRTDLRPVYRLIFKRLQALGCRWCYSFPQIYAMRFQKPEEAGDYDPSKGFAAEEEKRKQGDEDKRFQEQLDADVAVSKRKAWDEAPPQIVQAYQEVFGEDPSGWPPAMKSAG